MVLPVKGLSLYDCLTERLMEIRMMAAKQLLSALKKLHEAGIIHRGRWGSIWLLISSSLFSFLSLSLSSLFIEPILTSGNIDLNGGSVMWDMAPLGHLTLPALYEVVGRPQKAKIFANTWKEGEFVTPVQVKRSVLGGDIFLGDFGLSIEPGTSVKCKWQSPTVYCPPERFHGSDPSFAGDMWSYMCIFAQLYLGVLPFASHSVVTNFVQTLGPFPRQWLDLYDAFGKPEDIWYDQSQVPNATRSSESIVRQARPDVSDEELKLALSVMSRGFSFLPERRPIATQLLEDSAFNVVINMHVSSRVQVFPFLPYTVHIRSGHCLAR